MQLAHSSKGRELEVKTKAILYIMKIYASLKRLMKILKMQLKKIYI